MPDRKLTIPQYLAVHSLTVSHCPVTDISVPLSEISTAPARATLPTERARPPRAFAIAGLSAWNSLPDPVHNPNATEAAFRRLLKIFCPHGVQLHNVLFILHGCHVIIGYNAFA